MTFLSGATGQPENLARRVAFQDALGVPANLAAEFVDYRSYGGPFLITAGNIERQNIGQGGEPGFPLLGKFEVGEGPQTFGDVDPANPGLLFHLANLFRGVDRVDLTGGAYRWDFGLRGGTTPPPFLTILNDTDVIPRTRFSDVKLGGLTCAAAPNENFAIEFPFAVGLHDFHDEPTQHAGTGTLPVLTRTWDRRYTAGSPPVLVTGVGNWAPDGVDQDIFIRIDADNGATLDISCKVGAAAVYSHSFTVVKGDVYARLFDEDGFELGRDAEQVGGYFPVSGTYTALDEYRIINRRPAWTQTLGVERPISSVNTRFLVDDGTGLIESRSEGGWNIEATWETTEAVLDTANRQGASVEQRGDLNCIITPTRRVTDLIFQQRIHTGTVVSTFFDAPHDTYIGTSQERYRVVLGAPAGLVTGEMYGVEPGADNREEAPEIICGVPESPVVYRGRSWETHFGVSVWTHVADLAGWTP